MHKHFYPRSPCGERRRFRAVQNTQIDISIHALLAESDTRGERHANSQQEFLSTLSLRRATDSDFSGTAWVQISIHALLAESDRHRRKNKDGTQQFLSTLSLRRATTRPIPAVTRVANFYPRSPCGERRWLRCWQLAAHDISIHALLAESDLETLVILPKQLDNFYPRSPCGERLASNL